MNNIRKVQEAHLLLLKEFISICEKYQLRYYFVGGSLIGVLRHKGFIPWDDDIDVGMPRRDYEKFVSLQNTFQSGFLLKNHKNNPDWQFNFSQFIDNESEIIVKLNELPQKTSLWIDVYPLDGLPSSQIMRWLHFKRILLYRYLIQIPNLRTQVDTHKVGRPWYEKIAIKVLHYIPLNWAINVDALLDLMEMSLKKYSFDTSPWAGNLVGKYREKEIMRKEWWGAPVKLPFETIEVNCPAEWDLIETKIYGDYMKWPAEKDRVSHDIEIIKLRK